MYMYQQPGFSGYRKSDQRGQPCNYKTPSGKCGEPSIYFGTTLCALCSSAKGYSYRQSKGQKPTKIGEFILKKWRDKNVNKK